MIHSIIIINITDVGISIFLIKKTVAADKSATFICECSIEKNNFAESKNLARYKSENNFVE